MLGAWLTSRTGDRRALRWTLCAGVLARALLAACPPFTSNDIERYLWDGRVLLEGFDPYRWAPDSSALAGLRAWWPTPAEHAAHTTLYPPGALVAFAIAASAGPALGVVVWKIGLALASIATVSVMVRLLRERRLDRHVPLVALSPLLVLEAGIGGHVDALSALGVATALYFAHRQCPGIAGAALGIGALLKALPAFAIVPLALRFDRGAARVAGAAGSVIVCGFALALCTGLHPVGSLFVFFERWRFGSPLFAALAGLGVESAPPGLLLLLIGSLVVVAWLAYRGRGVPALQAALAIPLLLSPVVFPWYLTPLVPGLALAPSATLLAWLTAIPLTYEVIGEFAASGVWRPAAWPLWCIAAAWLIGGTIDGARCGSKRWASSSRVRTPRRIEEGQTLRVLRTPDERFENLPDFSFAPHYVEIASGGAALRVHYVDAGPRSAAPVLCLHGEPSWSFLYRKMIPGIAAAGHRVVAPDLVGFGRSDKPADRSDYTYQRHVDWLRATVEALDLRQITLFCQDWGGLLGLRLVAEQPNRFDRVVAANTFLPTGDRAPSSAFLAWREFSQKVPEFPTGRILQGATATELSPQVVAAYDAPFPDESYKAGARQFPLLVPISPDDPAASANRAAWERLERFEKPFLTAFSDGDPVTRGGDATLQARIAGARGQKHVTIAGGGHFLQEDRGEELAQVVVDFIASTRHPA